MTNNQTPQAYAKNLLAIYKGNTAAAIEAVKSSRNYHDAYWRAVIESLLDGAKS